MNSLLSILGLGKKKSASSSKTNSETDLELKGKLEIILSNISKKLSEKEVFQADYYNLVYSELKAQDIVSGNRYTEAENTGYFAAILNRKLSVVDSTGLMEDYCSLKNTILSENAKKDIEDFQNLKTDIGNHLKEKIGTEPVNEKYFRDTIKDYLALKLPKSEIFRKASLLGCFYATFFSNFNIVQPKRYVGGYAHENIEKVLKTID